MDKTEIIVNYRTAKNKAEQIQILADLNAVEKQDIIDILTEAGELPAAAANKLVTPAPQKKQSSKFYWTPDDIDRLRELLAEGLNDLAIAERFGAAESIIKNAIYRYRLGDIRRLAKLNLNLTKPTAVPPVPASPATSAVSPPSAIPEWLIRDIGRLEGLCEMLTLADDDLHCHRLYGRLCQFVEDINNRIENG